MVPSKAKMVSLVVAVLNWMTMVLAALGLMASSPMTGWVSAASLPSHLHAANVQYASHKTWPFDVAVRHCLPHANTPAVQFAWLLKASRSHTGFSHIQPQDCGPAA